MALLGADAWANMPQSIKDMIVSNIDQTLDFKLLPKVFRPFGTKPRLRLLSNGRWVVTNTCISWSIRDEWDIAIHWCNFENWIRGL